MPGSITPLPVMLEEEDQRVYERLEPPKSIVVRYGYQKKVAELPYEGADKPGCGSKLVIRTNRGIELAEMLTTTCPNAGCGMSVSRKQLLDYVENSGGKQYPFTEDGKVLRIASHEDLNEQRHLESGKGEIIRIARQFIAELQLDMRLTEVELLLGGERIIFYYTTEQKWVDFRELVRKLAAEYHTRIEMCQVNAREEARLVADYEKCGQYCCCKGFLKVLKPVSMRSAKVQKATLDPKKISGRCGRLMCCLRYEDETYETLRKRLPHKKQVVETEDGIGIVLDTQILTQLVLVKLDHGPPAAYPLENIKVLGKDEANEWRRQQRELQQQREQAAAEREQRRERRRHGEPAAQPTPSTSAPQPQIEKDLSQAQDEQEEALGVEGEEVAAAPEDGEQPAKKKRRRRRRRRRKSGGGGGESSQAPPSGE
ncbi:MAG: hypothetical protein IT445_20125 [Phycisphaeraceae bacterium]|nr:hypothetical protein [Phycisphaeraceae bacterium]